MSMAIASRYARALAEVLGAQGDVGAMQRELEDFAGVWRESDDLRQVLTSPTIPVEQKRAVLDAVIQKLEVSVTAGNFLRVLLVNYRISLLEEVLEAFQKAANERLGIIEVQVSYAQDLTPDEQETLRRKFAELTGKKVEMKFRREEKLLGGIQARVGSTIYDGSAQGYLERLRGRLTSA
ncbi:MAG TPA: ATP synthase F1 subunit delta [Terriglobia bacterium]|nr:ATP synthase F1 subunit delta [Terriglobia bacterium]HKT12242.1 ATP synthase F1 subunit delta [Terriglobia bacterium]